MKRITILTTSVALACVLGSGAFAGDAAKTTIKPLKVVKSTQNPTSLGLALGGGLGQSEMALLLVLGGIVAIGVIGSSTSGT